MRMMNDIEILDYVDEGYHKTMNFESWRVAFLNYAPRFDEANFTRMERHLLTDEVFVLIRGEGTLIVGEHKTVYKMETGKIYNIRKGVWHQIFVSRDAKVLIVENHNTGPENTEYMSVPV